MKKIIGLIVIGLILGCSDSKQGVEWYENRINVDVIDGDVEIDTYVHEECEYLIYSAANGYQGYSFGMHKGNCSNPIHQCE